MVWRFTFLRSACFGFVLGATVSAAPEIRVVGSDLLGIEFVRAVHAFAGSQALTLRVTLDGSLPAVDDVKMARAEIGLVVSLPGEDRETSETAALTAGYHRVVVLVAASCPMDRITLDQLAAIFGETGPDRVERWGDLGATGDFGLEAIVALAPGPGTG